MKQFTDEEKVLIWRGLHTIRYIDFNWNKNRSAYDKISELMDRFK